MSTIREARQRRGLHGGISTTTLDALFDVAEAAEAIDWVFHAGPIEMIAHRADFGDLHAALANLKGAISSADPHKPNEEAR
jgi:hypothetical protein